MIQVYDRNSKECYVEKEFGKGLLEFLYGNPVGRIILKTFIINKFYSKIKGMRERSKGSRKKIAEFIKEYDIDMTRYEEKQYKSFDEFFFALFCRLCPGIWKPWGCSFFLSYFL